jgi:Dyp-type peroxidase family
LLSYTTDLGTNLEVGAILTSEQRLYFLVCEPFIHHLLTPVSMPPILLNPKDPTTARLLDSIQGNILKGHGRFHTDCLLIRCHQPPQDINDPANWQANNRQAAKTWLAGLAAPQTGIVGSAWAQWDDSRDWRDRGKEGAKLFACVHLSAVGYTYLFPADGRIGKFEQRFQDGMIKWGKQLQDPPPERWEDHLQADIHLLLVLAHRNPDDLIKATRQVLADIKPFAGATVESGHVLLQNKRVVEHFGHRDGLSQPLFFEKDWVKYKDRNGVQDEKDLLFDPRASTTVALTCDPFVKGDPNALGSYLVFRKLEQNVRLFRQAEKTLVQQLGLRNADRDRAEAMLIGRFKDGTPVQLADRAGSEVTLNNFSFEGQSGSRCPYHAHIRKVSPRRTKVPEAAIVRRGISYGSREADFSDAPETGVGLLFMCYQASIGQQFERIQRNWANRADFPNDTLPNRSGLDPTIGQNLTARAPGEFAATWGDGSSRKAIALPSFVTLKGGEYFFAPSLAFLRGL